MAEGAVQRGRLIWAGEHWVSYIRREGEASDSGRVSLYHTSYSQSGGGNIAFVDIPGDDGYRALCADNAEVARFHLDRLKDSPEAQGFSIAEAEFVQGGDIRTSPSWTIRADGHEIVTTWSEIEPVVIANGPWAAGEVSYVFTLLHFANGASITLDGRTIGGGPYVVDVWREKIGGDRSSSVIALSETFIGDA